MQLRAVMWKIAIACVTCACFVGTAEAEGAEVFSDLPIAPVIPLADTTHGDVRIDDYAWLRDRDDPRVIAYLEAENAYTEAVMAHTKALEETLYRELVGRIKETDLTVPYRKGGYFYYTRTEEGEQYPIYCRKRGRLDAEEETILDQNVLAAGHDYCDVGTVSVSPDGRLLAYSVDTTGAERFTLYVKDLETGALLPDVIENVDYPVQWANDNMTLFYTTADAAERTDKLWRHLLGTDPADDELVYHEADEAYWVDVERTRSGQYIILSLEKSTSSEQWVLSADDPWGDFRLVEPRRPDVEYYLAHHGGEFFVRTNVHGKNFEVMRAPVSDPSRGNWEVVLPHRDKVKVERIEAFRDHLVVLERERGLRRIRVLGLSDGTDHYVGFPEPAYAVCLGDNEEFDTDRLRFYYASLVTPESVYDYDMRTGERELLKQEEVLGGYDPSAYVSERIFATAEDGADVPISLVYRRDLFRRGENPILVVGYGAYGTSMDLWFSPSRVSLLDRGFVYALAHVRGGGEMGEEWYDQGKLLNKRNTFTDFIACTEHLVAQGYGAPDKVVIWGTSAGGLLIGAVLNMRPDLFTVAVADVPFVDLLNTMLDPSIPLTVGEYEEWGNPSDPVYYEYMKSYSPYDNVGPFDYPDMLVTGGLNDTRVQYWEPAKWTAKLRATKTGHGILLLKMNMGAGHGGASGRYDRYRERAFKYAFILDRLGFGG